MVFKYLPGKGAPGTEHFGEMGQDEGHVFIVTADVPVCLDLRGWLQSIAASQGTRGTSAKPAQSDPDATQGFTGLRPDNFAPPLNSHCTAVASAAGTGRSEHEPGEFTRMFGTPSIKTKPPVSTAPKDDASPRPPRPSVPPAGPPPPPQAAKGSPGGIHQKVPGIEQRRDKVPLRPHKRQRGRSRGIYQAVPGIDQRRAEGETLRRLRQCTTKSPSLP